jgi:hypothetical protein
LPAPPAWHRSRSARARPTATVSTAAATASSTQRFTASRSRAPAATPRRRPTSLAEPLKARPTAKRSAASSATSPAASGTSCSRPGQSTDPPPHQFLDIGAAKAAVAPALWRSPCLATPAVTPSA